MSLSRSLLALGVVLAACTASPSPEPSPSPSPVVSPSPTTTEPLGVRVAVILPPPDEHVLTTAGTRLAAETVARRHGSALGEFRTLSPDPGEFRGDVAVLLAERGYDLVCIIGEGAVEPVLTAAAQFPATRFCGIAAVAGVEPEKVPDNALIVGHRTEEAAYLAGVAAAAAPALAEEGPDDDPTPTPAPAGFVGDGASALVVRQRPAFAAGLSAGLGGGATPRVDLTATTDEELLAAVNDQFDAGVPVVFLPGAPGDRSLLEAIGDRTEGQGTLIVHRDRGRFEAGTPPSVLVWFLLDVGVALDLAVSGIVGDWRSGVRTVGLADNAIRPQAGPAEGATTAFGRLRAAADGVRDGTTSVPGP